MINKINKVFRVMSCRTQHDGKFCLVLHRVTNMYDFEDVEVVDKLVDEKFGPVTLGDFFCMKKVDSVWEFSD